MELSRTHKKLKLPIEIINKILIYLGELNNDILILQYCINSQKEYYKLNKGSDFLWNIKSLMLTKRLYPLYSNPLSIMKHKEVYKYAKSHYEELLRKTSK
jgi:hypothetical protein